MAEDFENTQVTDTQVADAPQQEHEFPENYEETHRESIRDTIERAYDEAVETATAEEESREPEPKPRRERRSRERSEAQHQHAQPEQQQEIEVDQAPVSWRKEARQAWNALPAHVKQEVMKRETDMQKGVEALQQRYAEYDQTIAPWDKEARQYGKSAAQGAAQLYQWHDALKRDPDRAVPALLQTYGYDPRRLLAAYGVDPRAFEQFMGQYQQNPQYQQHQQAQQWQQLQNEVALLKQGEIERQQAYQQAYATDNQRRIYDVLAQFSADKPYFEQVRGLMGHLLTPDPQTGLAAVPLNNGQVDLNAAYEMACRASPQVSQQIRMAEQAARQQATDNRRKRGLAGMSISPTSPGRNNPGSRGSNAPKGKSVRESLRDAIAELS